MKERATWRAGECYDVWGLKWENKECKHCSIDWATLLWARCWRFDVDVLWGEIDGGLTQVVMISFSFDQISQSLHLLYISSLCDGYTHCNTVHLLPVLLVLSFQLLFCWERKKYDSGKFGAVVFFVWVVHVECTETVIWCLQQYINPTGEISAFIFAPNAWFWFSAKHEAGLHVESPWSWPFAWFRSIRSGRAHLLFITLHRWFASINIQEKRFALDGFGTTICESTIHCPPPRTVFILIQSI